MKLKNKLIKKNYIKNTTDQLKLTCQTRDLNHKTMITLYKPNQQNDLGQPGYLTKPATWVMKLGYLL
jgi:hypothetical protein